MDKNVLRKFVGTVLAFAAAFISALAVVCLILGTVFSPSVVKLFITDKYVSHVEGEILNDLQSYAIPGGLPADFFSAGFDSKLLREDINRAVDTAFSGGEYEVDAFKTGLYTAVEDYAAENGIELKAEGDKGDENITRLVSLCAKTYSVYTYSAPVKYIGVISRYIHPVIFIAGASLLVLSALLFWCAGRCGGSFFLRSGVSGAAVMLLAFPLYVLFSGSVARLGITSASMFSLVTGLIYTVLLSMIVLGSIMLILANIKLPFSRKGK